MFTHSAEIEKRIAEIRARDVDYSYLAGQLQALLAIALEDLSDERAKEILDHIK